MEDQEFDVRPMLLNVCRICRGGAGGECHVPGCSFWLNRAPDIPIAPVLTREELIRAGSQALVTGYDMVVWYSDARSAEAVLMAAGVIEEL